MPVLIRWALPAACAALVAAISPPDLSAQFFSFGQNKIQYRKLDWRILRGPHVDLYYYPAEAELAPAALSYAEASYDTLAVQFGHDVAQRVPLVVYASHTDFEQTNILPFTPPEGLLGATDFLKRRVSLPFRGNFSEFRHTLRHEMVHVFQLDLLSEAYLQSPRHSRFKFPLWWTEGLAELWSGGQDARDEMVLRDLTLTGRLPSLRQLTYVVSGIVYPLGGQIHRWLADTYGDWRVATMYKEQNRHDTFDAAIKAVYGRSLDELSDEFQLAMRRRYYPSVDSLAPLTVLAREVAKLAVKPAFLPDTDGGSGEVAYLSPATGYVAIYRRGLDSGHARTVVTGGRSAELESFHPFDSRMDASRPGLLLFIARYGDRDALVLWDLEKNRVRGRYQFPDAGVDAFAPVDARREEHRAERPLGKRGLRSLPGPPARGHPRAAHRGPLSGPRSQSRAGWSAHRVRLRPHLRRPGGRGQSLHAEPRQRPGRAAHRRRLERRGTGLGPRRPDLLHLRPRRGAQRVLGGYRGRRASGDFGLDRRVRRGAAARRHRVCWSEDSTT